MEKNMFKNIFNGIKIRKLFSKKEKELKEKNFIPLYPNYNSDNEIYVNRLQEALEDEDILNIGVTGPYGSGKSSILKGLIDKISKDKKVMIVSLATFGDAKEKIENLNKKELTNNEENNNEKNTANQDRNGDGKVNCNDIEIGILQQIIYKINPRKIPLSKIVRIKEEKEGIFEGILAGIIYFVYFDKLESIVLNIFEKLKKFNIEALMDLGLTKNILYILIYLLIWWIINVFLRKFNLTSISINGIDLTKESQTESILNKYIDEIIYILKKSKYEIIIFEDLDRFEKPEIFYKLRELNKIINDNDKIRKNGKVKFIYALRDNTLSKAEDRTKFFDYILPVIPVISSENAQLKFLEILEKLGFKGIVSEEIIQEISYFVKDMRMVINICNEFKVYYDKIFVKLASNEKDNFSIDKLFAIIAYKNVNVNDFEKMQYEGGDIQKLINLKKDLKEIENANIHSELTNINQSWNEYKTEKEKEIKKIRDDIRRKYSSKSGYYSNFYTKENYYKDENDFKENAEIEEILEYGIATNSNKNRFYTIEEIYKDNTWKEQYNKIKTEFEKRKEEFDEMDIKLTEQLEVDYKNQTLKIAYYEANILEEYLKKLKKENEKDINKENIILVQELIKNKMLIAFIRKGYIEEDYKYYINNVYLGNLSLEEHKFIVSIKTLEEKENFDVKIENFEVVNSRLNIHDYKNHNIMNVNLFDNLLNKHAENEKDELIKNKMNIMCDHAKNSIFGYDIQGTEKSFFAVMINKSQNLELFLQAISNRFYDIWKDIRKSEELTSAEKYEILNKFLSCNSVSEVCVGNIIDFYNTDIEKMKKIELVALERVKKYKSDLKFDDITEQNKDVFDYIIDNDMYKINIKNIKTILKAKLENTDITEKNTEKYDNSLLTNLLKIEHNSLSNRIKKDVEEILELETIEKATSEEFKNLLNNMTNEEKCKELIKGFNGKIQNILEIDNNSLWEELLYEEKVDINLDNLLKYNEHYYIDEKTAQIINANIDKIIFDLKQTEKEKEKIKEFLLECLKFDEIEDENLFKFLECCDDFKVEKYEFKEINENRIRMLIDQNYILFNDENYNFVKEEIKDKLYDFCKNNIDKFIEIYDELEVENELTETLAFSNIIEEYQLILFEKLEYNVTYRNVDDANKFLKIINRDDSNYKDYFDFIRTMAFFEYSNEEEIKVNCFIKYLDKLSNDDAHMLLETFENEEYKKISNNVNGKPQPFLEGDMIIELIKKLKDKKYINARYLSTTRKWYIKK